MVLSFCANVSSSSVHGLLPPFLLTFPPHSKFLSANLNDSDFSLCTQEKGAEANNKAN